jgi:serine phosphatase RsbU (regulator of sigma subunit)
MNLENFRQALNQFSLFASLPAEEIDTLAATFEERFAEPGELLMTEGARTERVFLLLDGEVEIIKSLGTTDERLLASRQKGTSLGDMSLFTDQRTHTASVRARTPLHMLVMSLVQFDSLIQTHPSLAYAMLKMLNSRLVETENLIIADLREKNRQLTQAYEDLKAAQAAMIVKEKLEHELQLANGIQRSILPQRLPSHPDFDYGAIMVPARQVGGDFYDFIPLPDGRVGIVVGDVCDKGMPAALFMALTYSSMRSEAHQYASPGDTLRAVNAHLKEISHSSMYVTMLYGILDTKTKVFAYARAGHTYPVILDGEQKTVQLASKPGQPLGIFYNVMLDEQEVTIPEGGMMLIYSDGLSETIEALEPPLEVEDLCSSLFAGRETCPGAQEFCDMLWRAAGGEGIESLITDDFTVVAVNHRRTESSDQERR